MYQIEGMFREPALMLEVIIILLSIEIGSFFLYRFIKEGKRAKNFMILVWTLFFFAYSVMTLLFILSDYYFLFMSIAPYYLAILALIPFFLILTIYLKRAFSKIKEYRNRLYSIFIGFLVFGIGFAFTIEIMVNSFGSISRMIGNIAIIFGISLASWQFVGLPSLREMDWSKQLNTIVIMHKSGTCICEYDFIGERMEKESSKDGLNITVSLIGIAQMITELIQSKQNLEIMDYQDKQIVFSYGDNVIAALIVENYLEIYRKKLGKLLNEIEVIYKDYLEDWDGQTSQFKPIEKFIRRIFS